MVINNRSPVIDQQQSTTDQQWSTMIDQHNVACSIDNDDHDVADVVGSVVKFRIGIIGLSYA